MNSSILKKLRSLGSALSAHYSFTSSKAREMVTRSHQYHFRSQWAVDGSVEDVAEIFLDSRSLPCWWPQFHDTWVIEPGDSRAQGRVFRVVTKGWLPYKLRFQLQVTDVEYPGSFRVESTGDFQGVGTGTLRQHGGFVTVDWDWQITVGKPLLKFGSPFLKRLLTNNHYWLMRRGERQLRRLLVSGSPSISHS